MSIKQLIEQVYNLDEMAFDAGRFPSFIHPSKKEWIETGDEELDALLPKLSKNEQTYLEMITSKSYQDMVARFQKYTGLSAERLNIPQISSLMWQSIQKVIAIESKQKKLFEDLALNSVLDLPEFEMVKEAYEQGQVKFDIKLGGGELQKTEQEEPEEEELSFDENANVDFTRELEDVDDAKLKRRLANMLIQGSSVLKTYLFNVVAEELDKIDKSLVNLYGILAVMTQLGYWITPFGIEEQAKGAAAGSEEVIPEGDEYTIKIRAIAFPYLVHEIVKGVYEWVSISKEQKQGMEQDSIEKETKDIIVGPELFKSLTSYIPSGKQNLVPLIHKMFLKLPKDEIKDVLAKNSKGQDVMKGLIQQAQETWDEYKRNKGMADLGEEE